MKRICLALGATTALAVALSCSESNQERTGEGAQNRQPFWGTAPPSPVAVILGAGAGEGQRADCQKAVKEHEGEYGPGAPVTVDIDVKGDAKILRVFIQGSKVREETRPAWPVVRLCRDALVFGMRVALEQAGSPPAVAVALGPQANEDQQRGCQQALSGSGVPMGPGAPITAMLTVDPSDDSERPATLQIAAGPQGVVAQGLRPRWSIDTACQDALIQTMRAQLLGLGAPPPAAAPQQTQP